MSENSSCSRSSSLAPNSIENDQPSSSTRGPEAEPTTNSRYSFFRGRKRSLDPESLRRALWHSQANGASSLRRPSASGFDLRQGKTTHFLSPHRVPRQGSPQVSQSFSERVALQIPILRTLVADLSVSHRASTFPK